MYVKVTDLERGQHFKYKAYGKTYACTYKETYGSGHILVQGRELKTGKSMERLFIKGDGVYLTGGFTEKPEDIQQPDNAIEMLTAGISRTLRSIWS